MAYVTRRMCSAAEKSCLRAKKCWSGAYLRNTAGMILFACAISLQAGPINQKVVPFLVRLHSRNFQQITEKKLRRQYCIITYRHQAMITAWLSGRNRLSGIM